MGSYDQNVYKRDHIGYNENFHSRGAIVIAQKAVDG